MLCSNAHDTISHVATGITSPHHHVSPLLLSCCSGDPGKKDAVFPQAFRESLVPLEIELRVYPDDLCKCSEAWGPLAGVVCQLA